MHVQSIFWFALAVLVAALLYRQFIVPPWAAGLAALMYALDEVYYFPVAWLANRSAVISLFFGLMALFAHDRWRRRGSLAWAISAPLFLLMALLAEEGGITVLAYFGAYVLFLDNSSLVRRALSLLPSLIVVAGWRVLYSALGYGATGIGGYIDPHPGPVALHFRHGRSGAHPTPGPVVLTASYALQRSE